MAPEPAPRRRDAAEEEARLREVQVVDAHEVRSDPEARSVRPERGEAEAEVREDERAVPEDEIEVLAAPQVQSLRPREDGIEARGERDPLRGIPEEAGEDPREAREAAERRDVPEDARRSRAGRGEREEREGRKHGRGLAQERPHGRRRERRVRRGARGLLQAPHPRGEDEARQADGEERGLPAAQAERARARRERGVPAVDDEAPDPEAETRAEVDAARVEPEHRGALLLREPVREERVRRGRRARLADADAHAREGEGREGPREAGERRHEAPERGAPRDEAAAVPRVREAAERDPEDGEEDGEDGAVEEPELRVRDAEVRLDALGEDRDDLPVEEVEDVDEDEDGEDVARIRPAPRGLFGSLGHRRILGVTSRPLAAGRGSRPA